MKKRLDWLDVAKGITILLVVLGHSLPDIDVNNQYIYWFHMPAFFFITGITFSPPTNKDKFKSFFVNRFAQLAIPYISFLILITLFRYLSLGMKPISWYINDLIHVIAGGQSIPSAAYVTMWFITCLFTSQLLISLVIVYIKNNTFRVFIVIAFYLLAHVEALLSTIYEIHIPGNIDVSLLAISYIYIGMFVKQLLGLIQKKSFYTYVFAFSLFFSVFFVILSVQGILDYKLDMYQKEYFSYFLDLFIPLNFTVVLFGVSHILTKIDIINPLLQNIGKSSLLIMYLHIPIKLIHEYFFGKGLISEITLMLLGVVVPMLLFKFLNKSHIASILLLGKNNKKLLVKQVL